MTEFFKGKVVWITGASSGIGEALALRLASYDAIIILSSRKKEVLEDLRLRLKNPDSHGVVTLDLLDSGRFNELAEEVVTDFGRIDILINNGGLSQRANASESGMDIDRKIMEINYFGNIALTKAVLPIFKRQQSGHFLVVSSIAGKFGFFLRSAYSASKHALHGFYESLMLEEEKNGVKVTIACPGKINTNISVNALDSTGKTHGIMDHNQSTGMSADECARQILKALVKNKQEVLIGNKEIKAVKLKRFFPKLFWKIIRKQPAT
jgi:short-subunit dehydrogenase